MSPATLAAAALAGAVVVLTPGPAVLALIGIGAAQGRRAGAGFLFGHLVGDLLWATLAVLALAWVSLLSPAFFRTLALVCGIYLGILGVKAVLAAPGVNGAGAIAMVRRPFLRGLTFGVTNPKSYPVTLAVFTAVLGASLEKLQPAEAPVLLAASFSGFLLADLILIWLVGLAPVRRFYRQREIWVVRVIGLLFIGFALVTMAQAV